MDVLSQIRKPIEAELESFKNLFDFTLQHRNPLLETALRHVLGRKGKMMRPILLFLAAKKCGAVTDQALHAAVSLEMLHTASLVHDDVVDESAERRGQKSVNALLDNKAAVLVGDYMLSTALKHAALNAACIDASLIHEAAIGKIAGEQIIKLCTLGLTEEEAERKIIEGFLK